MYDMYSWDQPVSPADETAEAGPAPRDAARPAVPAPAASSGTQPASAAEARAARAVQVALDRRDNGGDAGPGRPR